jgi:CRP/FNR family transcriptional activator FtrB
MRADELEQMRGLQIFAGVETERVERMLRVSFLQRFPQGVELAREGELADFLHVVIEGAVEVYASWRDRETTVAVLGPGQCFILAAVLLDRVYLKSARVLQPSRVLLLPAGPVRETFGQDAAFARRLASDLAEAYRMVVKELKNHKLRTGIERLANWLLVHREATGSGEAMTLPFEKKVLAAHLGMAPEVLSRSFTALAPYGVKVIGPTVHFADLEALRTLAKPSPIIDDPKS